METPSANEPIDPAASELESLEVRLLLEGLLHRAGLDFRHYAPASLRRRVRKLVADLGTGTITCLLERVLHDPETCERVTLGLTINTTSMFRDPSFFREFRREVIPRLGTYPVRRLWVAGCATGEEVYSLAILLEEAGLAERSQIYATDINESVLATAERGIFPLSVMREYTQNYLQAGGTRDFSTYYATDSTHAIMASSLRRNVSFSRHNLATDASFNEFHVILCRNVMIYFDAELQTRVFDLLHGSLARLGSLCIGRSESLLHHPHSREYELVVPTEKIFRRKS